MSETYDMSVSALIERVEELEIELTEARDRADGLKDLLTHRDADALFYLGELERVRSAVAEWRDMLGGALVTTGPAAALMVKDVIEGIDALASLSADAVQPIPSDGYKAAYLEWSEKTDFIQDWISSGKIPPKYLGWHRADVMRDLIDQAQPAPVAQSEPGQSDAICDSECTWRDHSPHCIAAKWREQKGYIGKGGVVVLGGRTVDGWVDKLRDPENWMPGAIAVDESGNQWEARGGDVFNGAERWEQVAQSQEGEQ